MIFPIPTKNDVQIFLRDWGINPGADGISGYVYCQMLKDATQRFGVTFANFISGVVDSRSGKYRINAVPSRLYEALEKKYGKK